jgi:hypothetical protein
MNDRDCIIQDLSGKHQQDIGMPLRQSHLSRKHHQAVGETLVRSGELGAKKGTGHQSIPDAPLYISD